MKQNYTWGMSQNLRFEVQVSEVWLHGEFNVEFSTVYHHTALLVKITVTVAVKMDIKSI